MKGWSLSDENRAECGHIPEGFLHGSKIEKWPLYLKSLLLF